MLTKVEDTMVLPPPPVQQFTVRCPACDAPMGVYQRKGNHTWLLVGNFSIRVAHGVCCQCGAAFHFSTSEKMLEEIINRLTVIDSKAN